MKDFIELLKVWEGYPAAILAALSPWLAPFRLDVVINTLWRPEIDAVADITVVLFVIVLMKLKRFAGVRFDTNWKIFLDLGVFFLSLGFCYFMKQRLIHLIDADLVWLANIPWAVAYCLMLASIAFFVFCLMSAFGGGDNNASQRRSP
tara:strand:+ start:3684 stop:4127 length:444 start_codon:yes stop_codon:yes gene_type:complete